MSRYIPNQAQLFKISDIWSKPIVNQKQKEMVAEKIAKRLKSGEVVGVGSGSTSFLALKALAERQQKESLSFRVITTSLEMELACAYFSIPTTSLISASPHWSFDGADEVDSDHNLIKGRGGAMLREKLLIKSCPEVYIAVDQSKLVKRLGEKFAVPIEVHPEAVNIVQVALTKFPTATDIRLRQGTGKDGPIITENGNVIFDVKFSHIAADMERKLKSIVGVVETGLFMGYRFNVISN